MTDYTPIDDDEIIPDAPIPSMLGFRWRDNPIAIAEGAEGAPKVEGRALDVYLGGGALPYQGAGAIGFSDLDRETWLMCFGTLVLSSGANVNCYVSFSADNGATWGAWATIAFVSSADLDPKISFSVMINLRTHGSAPANANAVRFSYAGPAGTGAGGGRIDVLSFGGLP